MLGDSVHLLYQYGNSDIITKITIYNILFHGKCTDGIFSGEDNILDIP